MKCKNCGFLIDDDSRFCDNCGCKIEIKPEMPTTNTKSKSKKKMILILILSVILAVAIGVGIFFFIQGRTATKESMQENIKASWSQSIETEEETPEFVKMLDSRSSFEVKKVTNDGSGHYTVTVSVSAPNIKDGILNFQKEIDEKISQEEMDKQIAQIAKNAELVETEQTVTVIMVDGEPEVTFSEGFIDAMYGYTYSDILSQLQEYYNVDY